MFGRLNCIFTCVALAAFIVGCGFGPTTSVQGTAVVPDGVVVSEAAILSVHLTGFDSKWQHYVTFKVYKKKNPGNSPFQFEMRRVPVNELKKYARYHVYAEVDMNGDGRLTLGELQGSTDIEIRNPTDPIKDVRVQLRY